MAFGILLNTQDLVYMASQLTRPDLVGMDTIKAAKIWDGGLRHWQAAPQPPYELLFGDPDMRIVSFETNNMSSTEFVAALRAMSLVNNEAKYPANEALGLADSVYLDALADHINNTKIEPYND